MRACTQAWERSHKSVPGSLSTPRMTPVRKLCILPKRALYGGHQSAEKGGNLNSASQCVSKELKKAWRNIHSAAFNINISLQDSVVSFNDSGTPEKQPAPNLKPGNLTVHPQRFSHIFLPSIPALHFDAWPRGHPGHKLKHTDSEDDDWNCWTVLHVPKWAPPPPQLTETIRWRAVTLWLSAVAFNTRGRLHYSKQCRWTRNQQQRMHACVEWSWQEQPRDSYVNCPDCPAPCPGSTI